MKKSLLLLVAVLTATFAFSQSKTDKQNLKNSTSKARSLENLSVESYPGNLPSAPRTMFNGSPISFQPKSIQPVSKSGLKIESIAPNGQVIAIKGQLENAGLRTGSMEVQGQHYLEAAGQILKVKNPNSEFKLKINRTDDLGITHLRYEQQFEGLKIYNSEVILHANQEGIFMLNGRNFPTPNLLTTTPQITESQALVQVEKHLTEVRKEHYEKDFDTKFLGTEKAIDSELIVFFPKGKKEAKLAWHTIIHPNLMKRFEYFTDAATGEILDSFGAFCQFARDGLTEHSCKNHHSTTEHETDSKTAEIISNLAKVPAVSNSQLPPGPEEAFALDLNGQSRRIQTYLHQGTYFMIDAAKPMHNAPASIFPNEGSGVIWTINGQGGTPARPNSFQATHVTSGDNSWGDRRAVSAHFNAEQAYLYFLNTHKRNSINDLNGNIMSFYNIAENDGSDMDNAFWNGAGIFYGNGKTAFNNSLAKSLDVAGHEMAHGVIQTTANLEYQGESGALNESFADIFAVMIDRDDWKIGEDIVNPQIFPTGAMRDMANPNNGGSGVSDQTWQPAHYNERYTGSADNGGVHINSGIPNHAFYLFANSAGVGREIAEKVFYHALDEYLVRSSQFVDLRVATLQSVTALGYGATVRNALAKALDDVGIPGGSGNDYQNDIDENPGEGFMILTDTDKTALYLADAGGALIGNPFLQEEPISKVSVTDDGTYAYFIAKDKKMYRIDFAANSYRVVQNLPMWVNVAVSKDGSKVAALSDDLDNSIWVFDFVTGESQTFFLYNPTFTIGVETGDVVFPDIIEWDFSGEWIMYDALNRLPTNFGELEYWDIGFVNVWNNSANDFADGVVTKLYSVTPENVDIGNPTFSKNSPHIISFDYHTNGSSYDLMTANIQSGEESTPPLFLSGDWNFPNFDIEDKHLTFDASSSTGEAIIAKLPISTNKLARAGDPTIFLRDGASKGVWYGNGTRVFTDTENVDFQEVISFFPNPTADELTVEIDLSEAGEMQAVLFDLTGRKLSAYPMNFGRNTIDVSNLPDGSYFVSVQKEGQILRTERVVVLK